MNMATRLVKDAKDINTGNLIYFKGHADATYLSDGSTVSEVLGNTIKKGDAIDFITDLTNPTLILRYLPDINTPKEDWNIKILNDKLLLGCVDGTIVYIEKDGDMHANAFYQTSDINKKNIISDVNVDIEDIANAPSVKFTYKGKDDTVHAGTIALYWKEVLPEVINGEEGDLTVDYATLATINSILLAKKIMELEETILNLKSELTLIKQSLKTLLSK